MGTCCDQLDLCHLVGIYTKYSTCFGYVYQYPECDILNMELFVDFLIVPSLPGKKSSLIGIHKKL